MRNASATGRAKSETNTGDLRATFVIPRDTADRFRLIAKRNQRTFSGELRAIIDQAIADDEKAA